jgi:uncharacterized protein YndB with AHSA1/START domain
VDSIEREVRLGAAPHTVWAALVDPGRLGEWLGGDLDLDIRPGAFGSFRAKDTGTRRVVVLFVDVGRGLSFRWWSETDVGAASTVEITLRETEGGGSTVRVRETRAQALQATA